MDTSAGTSDADDRANELYWGSDRSVNQIADDLDLSKGALYEVIRPLAAGLDCPECGAEVVHSNRTARDRGRVDCTECGWEGSEDEARAPAGATPRRSEEDDPYAEDDFDVTSPVPASATSAHSDTRRLVAGGALIGAALGLALVIWARRR
jgi:predicted RNA-binding Zn-ribbon protein involved in translation (DUF1610 family)